VMTLGRYAYRWWMGRLALLFDRDLRTQFFSALMDLPLAYLVKEDIGDIMARATNDMQAIRQFLIFGLMAFTDVIVMGISTVVLMLSLNGTLFLVSVGPILIIAALALFFSRYIFKFFKVVQDTFGKLTEKAQEFIGGIRVLRAFAGEAKVLRIFGAVNREYYQANMRLVRLEGVFEPSLGFLVTLSTILTIWFGVGLMQSGALTLGILVAYINYVNTLSWPMMALGFTTTIFQRSRASMKRVEEILYAKKEEEALEPQAHPAEAFQRLEVRGLSYQLEGRKFLDRISFRLEEGHTMGVVGPIGAGKTTLFRLLLRLVESEEGRVFINGADVRHIPMPALRRYFAFVPQDTYLFSATLLENIRYSRPQATREEVEEATRISCLESEISQFPEGLETLVGERGVTLSGGQRQRVAIARAIVSGRPVLLLDDSLSAVDTVTEERLVANLKEYVRGSGRSAISISHRVSTLLWTDQILVLLGGKVTENDAPSKLLERGGYFAHLYRAQVLEGAMGGSTG
jgi:ATP-binding cassette subfamily B multidrug efflux pump